jgi:hypothetical protein
LLIASFIAIAILANYSNLQSQLQIATQQAKQEANERARAEDIKLKEASSAEESAASQPQSPSNATGTESQMPNQASEQSNKNSAVQSAKVINGGQLILGPANITLSLSKKLPMFTVSAPNGTPITLPSLTSAATAPIRIQTTDDSSGTHASWSMRLAGKPKPGVYYLPIRATSTEGPDTIEYSGTLIVVVGL